MRAPVACCLIFGLFKCHRREQSFLLPADGVLNARRKVFRIVDRDRRMK